jgi:hypothetical protein
MAQDPHEEKKSETRRLGQKRWTLPFRWGRRHVVWVVHAAAVYGRAMRRTAQGRMRWGMRTGGVCVGRLDDVAVSCEGESV